LDRYQLVGLGAISPAGGRYVVRLLQGGKIHKRTKAFAFWETLKYA
jgi:hypothetical protein